MISPSPILAARRRRRRCPHPAISLGATASALLAGWPAAAPGQDLVVDGANNNSPYIVSADAAFANVTVGGGGSGAIGQSANVLRIANSLTLGLSAGSDGTYNLDQDGSVLDQGTATVGAAGTGTFNQSGGTHAVLGGGGLILGSLASGRGTYNLDGGTLTVGALHGGAGATSTLNLNGGTLQAGTANADFLSGLRRVNVRNLGAVVDAHGFAVTVSQALLHSNLGGDATTDGGLTKTGAGVLTLSGANTYRGATTITAGTVAVPGANNLGAGGSANRVVFDGATDGELRATATLSLGRAVTVNAGAAATLSAAPGATLTVNNGFTLGANAALTFGAAGQTGTVLFNPNTNTGGAAGTTLGVNAGTLRLAAGSNVVALDLIAATNVQTVAAGATLDVNGQVTATSGTLLSNLRGAGTLLTGGGPLVGISAGDFPGVIAGPSGVFKNNPGTLTLSGVNAYAGDTFVRGGTLALTAGRIGLDASTATVNVGAIAANGAAFTLSGNGRLSSAQTVVGGEFDATAFGTFNQGAGTTHTILGSGGLVLAGNANGAATYNLDGGALTTPRVQGGPGEATFRFNGGTLRAAASDDPGAAANPVTFFGGVRRATVDAGGAVVDTNGFNVTLAANLLPASAATADGGLTKTGAGTLRLTGASLYTGPTSVNAGTLLVNNPAPGTSGTGAGTVSVLGGATLGGNGTVGGGVTLQPDGTLSPGEDNAPGRLTLNGSLSLGAGSTLSLDLAGSAAAGGGGGGGNPPGPSDQVAIGGTLSLLGANLSVRVAGGSLTPGTLQTFFILDRTGADLTPAGTFANAPGGVYTDAAGNVFLVNYADRNPADSDLWSNDVSLTFGATVPEPGTWALLLTAGVVLLGAVKLNAPRRQRRPPLAV